MFHKAMKRNEDGTLFFHDEDKGVRTINRVMSGQFTINTEIDGKIRESWLAFPKASDLLFVGEDTVIILEDDKPLLTYTIL